MGRLELTEQSRRPPPILSDIISPSAKCGKMVEQQRNGGQTFSYAEQTIRQRSEWLMTFAEKPSGRSPWLDKFWVKLGPLESNDIQTSF